MAKLLLVAPFFDYDKNVDIYNNELASFEDEFEELGIETISFRHLDTKTYLFKGVQIVEKVPKGTIIRLALEANKSERNDYFISIDGDGQIPRKHILDILKQLVNGVPAVLSCRKNKSGIDETRSTVEKFELFLLSQAFGSNLPDGECGLWGFDKNTFERIFLSANGFEIELDFLTELLTKKIKFRFVHTDVSESEITTVGPDNDKNKLIFLRKKLGFGKDFISSMSEKFETNTALPTEYKKAIQSLDDTEILNYPLCSGTCEGCNHRQSQSKK